MDKISVMLQKGKYSPKNLVFYCKSIHAERQISDSHLMYNAYGSNYSLQQYWEEVLIKRNVEYININTE